MFTLKQASKSKAERTNEIELKIIEKEIMVNSYKTMYNILENNKIEGMKVFYEGKYRKIWNLKMKEMNSIQSESMIIEVGKYED